MTTSKTLFLVRHGNTGQSGRYIGAKDIPLADTGVEQIRQLQGTLQQHTFDHVIASPMLRCRQSCEILFPRGQIQYREELREIDFGRWEGLTFQEIASTDKSIVSTWAQDPLGFQFPDGEAVASFLTRVEKAASLLAELDGKKICVVCHGGVIRGLLCQFLGISHTNYLLFQVNKGRYTTVELFGKEGVLTGLNLQ